MKKKVMYITNLPAPYKVDFFNELSKYVDLTVVFERVAAKNRDKSWEPSKAGKEYREIWLSGINYGNEMSLSFSILKLLRNNRNNLILINGYSSPTEMAAILYMKLKKIKFGIVCDGLLEKEESTIKRKWKSVLISAASFWMSSGVETERVLAEHGADCFRIFHYPFTSIREADIASVPYDRKDYKEQIGCESKYMILYVGQMIYRKGIDILETAFQELNLDVQLYLIGGNIEVTSEKVVNIGFIEKSELEKYYKAADLFVLPSREDIWGLVVNEALGYGVPVVATDRCGAALEMIEDEKNGAVVPAGSVGSLKGKIEHCLQQSDAGSFMLNAVEQAQNYTIEKMAKRTWEIISQW